MYICTEKSYSRHLYLDGMYELKYVLRKSLIVHAKGFTTNLAYMSVYNVDRKTLSQ